MDIEEGEGNEPEVANDAGPAAMHQKKYAFNPVMVKGVKEEGLRLAGDVAADRAATRAANEKKKRIRVAAVNIFKQRAKTQAAELDRRLAATTAATASAQPKWKRLYTQLQKGPAHGPWVTKGDSDDVDMDAANFA